MFIFSYSKSLTLKLTVVVFHLIFSLAVNGAMIIKVTGNRTLEREYLAFEAKRTKPVEQLTQLTSEHNSQMVSNLVIIKQALYFGGLDIAFEFVPAHNVKHSMRLVAEGSALIASNIPFASSIDVNVFQSSSILGHGGFIKGVYGLASNKELMKVSSLKELQAFSVITNATWRVDISTLEALKPKAIYFTPLLSSMVRQIKYRRVDFILLKLNLDEAITSKLVDVKLTRVPGVGIELIGTRHIIVSKKHPDGEKTYKALEKGLAVMRAKGLIRQFYQDVGTLPKNGENIKVLNAKNPKS